MRRCRGFKALLNSIVAYLSTRICYPEPPQMAMWFAASVLVKVLLLCTTAAAGQANCDFIAPEHGSAGECPSRLASSSSCRPTCNSGYTKTTPNASCMAGLFSPIRCFDNAYTRIDNTYCRDDSGNGHPGGRKTQYSTFEACQAACTSNSTCRIFTWAVTNPTYCVLIVTGLTCNYRSHVNFELYRKDISG